MREAIHSARIAGWASTERNVAGAAGAGEVSAAAPPARSAADDDGPGGCWVISISIATRASQVRRCGTAHGALPPFPSKKRTAKVSGIGSFYEEFLAALLDRAGVSNSRRLQSIRRQFQLAVDI